MTKHLIGETQENEIETLSPEQVEEAVAALAGEILDKIKGNETAFVGIYTRGVTLANRVAGIAKSGGREIPVGSLDVSLYRDDLDALGADLPKLESSRIPFSLDGSRVILFDDVIFTGRTVRAALDELSDFGRPSKVELAVLVDRGWREIPIQPDYTGFRCETEREERISVRFAETDGEEGVFLTRNKPG